MNLDLETYLWKMYVLLERSSRALFSRTRMVVSTCVIYIVVATLLGFALGNTTRAYATKEINILGQVKVMKSSTFLYNTTAFFAISLLVLVFANVQFIFYWMKTNEVFLKEHSRGLYSNVQQWMTSSPALYLVRAASTAMYGGIAYNMLCMRIKSDIMWFYFLSLILAVEAGMMLCEAIATAAPDIRTSYQLIPGIVFFNFAFSGIFIKGPTIPPGVRWLPNLSLFRWAIEAQSINLYNDNANLVCVDPFYFCTYDAYLELFGWMNESKWYCLWIIVVNMAVYRMLILLGQLYKTYAQRGRRQFRQGIEEEERLY